jgi:NADH-quinone oxidoreductase subunit N
VINSAIGAYYYLRIIVMMYMRDGSEDVPITKIPLSLGTALALSLAATIYLGVIPGRVLDFALRSANEMMR